ncbi:MAG: hypothetical protein OSP8Acid_02130 [uncultured Acidilobus sp. OSP8]|nr:MAG: hypothetical protein OSP8Acid_02130 [uncultured Acidilobus sp. OSP8]
MVSTDVEYGFISTTASPVPGLTLALTTPSRPSRRSRTLLESSGFIEILSLTLSVTTS